jgi:putative intracellular protease/amidase/SAM-dependent methyltransferase
MVRAVFLFDKFNSGGSKSQGIHISSLADAYYAFKELGFVVELSSPKGGPVPISGLSMIGDDFSSNAKIYMHDGIAIDHLGSTSECAEIDFERVDVLFLLAGNAQSAASAQAVTAVETCVRGGSIVVAVGEATSILAACKKSDGSPLLKSMEVTGSPETERDCVACGADYRKSNSDEPFIRRTSGTVKLITGQNFRSSCRCVGEAADMLKGSSDYAAKLKQFYIDGGRYDAWAATTAVGDSITPSAFCADYREHLLSLVRKYSDFPSSIVSIGCGNATMETIFAKAGYHVLATDMFEECSKYVEHVDGPGSISFAVLDVLRFEHFEITTQYDIVYIDGVVGHLLDLPGGVEALFDAAAKLVKTGGILLMSNDPPANADVEKNKHVPAFHFVNENHLRTQMESHNFTMQEFAPFDYQRPVSGNRTRVVVVGKKTENQAKRARLM